jgi:zinc transport system ATP-binding protein
MPAHLTSSLDPAVVAAEDLTVELGGLPVIRGVSLAVRAGEAVALLGGNGSGKTTLMRALLGLTPTQRGEIRLFDRPLRSFRDWSRVGYVPQRTTATQTEATVEEIVATGRLARRRPFLPAGRADRAAVREALDLVGLLDLRRSDIRRLSGGQQQRALIARALAGAPELLMLDEPTAGVDLEHQRLLAAVVEQRLDRGMAVVVVLHEVGVLSSVIDRAVVLHEGRVVHDGSTGVLKMTSAAAPHHDHPESAARPWLGGTVGNGPAR